MTLAALRDRGHDLILLSVKTERFKRGFLNIRLFSFISLPIFLSLVLNEFNYAVFSLMIINKDVKVTRMLCLILQ